MKPKCPNCISGGLPMYCAGATIYRCQRKQVEAAGLPYNPKYTYIPVYANDYDGDLEGFAIIDEHGRQINDL